jgi:hypothetical protein
MTWDHLRAPLDTYFHVVACQVFSSITPCSYICFMSTMELVSYFQTVSYTIFAIQVGFWTGSTAMSSRGRSVTRLSEWLCPCTESDYCSEQIGCLVPSLYTFSSMVWDAQDQPFTAQYGPPAQWNFVSGCKVRSSLFLREHQWDTAAKQVFLRMDQVCSFLSTRMVKTYHFGVHSFLTFCRVKGRLITELHILWSVLRWLMGNGSWEPNYTLLIPKLFWYPKAYLATTWLVLRFIDVIFDFGWSISICIELQQ